MAEENFVVESAPPEYKAEYIKAEKTALALIARAEQCTYGLQYKLEKKKYPGSVIQAVLSGLTETGLVNDLRYSQLWLKMKISRGNKGPRMLALLLKAKGIDNETAKAALNAVLAPETESMLLKSFLDKTLKDKKGRAKIFPAGNSADKKTAIRHFLKAEGFSADAIEDYCEGILTQ